MRKKRGYTRDIPKELVRDYRLFAIACEGSKTEPTYFGLFRHMSNRIAVDIIGEIVSDEEMLTKLSDKSAPKWVLDRAVKYIEKEGLSKEDSLWFVIDVDKWKFDQIKEIADYCDQNSNWNIVLSNPCFEIWLHFHSQQQKLNEKISCKQLKNLISNFDKGGYVASKFIPHLRNAVLNAKNADSNINFFFPSENETKVYQLGEAILTIIGSHFEEFINNVLPRLLNNNRSQRTKRK
ncbi:MAG TPA: RloB family protein [Chitinophagaceae bacterium]|nr:RloB family protein [Chitinophagaceae bacterium]